MADLTDEERLYALSLLVHPVVPKLFAEIERDLLNTAVATPATETEKINAVLGEVRALRNLQKSLEIMSFEAKRRNAAG